MAGPFDERTWRGPAPSGSAEAGNPRTYPDRPLAVVADEVRRAAHQHEDLVASMAASGQTGALVVARLEDLPTSRSRACTLATWSQGPTTVLPVADVLALFELPSSIDGSPQVTYARWRTVERVCGIECWRVVRGLDPTRVITRAWPSADALAVIRGLSLPAPHGSGPHADV